MINGRNGTNGLSDELKADAVHYFKNGVSNIAKVPQKDGLYVGLKHVHEGCGIVYRGVICAIDAVALARSIPEDKLPKNVDEIRSFLKAKSALNGKVIKAFNKLYAELHKVGYYGRKDDIDPDIIKLGISNARFVIEKLTGKRIS